MKLNQNDKMKQFTSDIIIGLEVHAELNTKTKLFCSCPTKGSEEPNTRCCPVCLGHPGSKPVLNKKAVECAIKLCLALNCRLAQKLIFSRKSYFYPDMAKNFQITQYEIPLGRDGNISLGEKEIGIARAHIEEDPASLVHPSGMKDSSYVLVDYNRSGNPLIEIVTKPDMAGPDEAREFMKHLITILEYIEIFDANSGIIKADANISVKESDYTRVEIKNITGFKEIERALFYEVKRQKEEISRGRAIHQETRSWDSEKGITFSLRKKETEEDYGYIIDTDLTFTEIDFGWVSRVKESMPELAKDKVKRFIEKYGIKKEDAEIIASDRTLAELLEKIIAKINPELAAKWLRRELLRVLNYNKKTLKDIKFDETHLIELLELVEHKKITDSVASKILEKLIEKPFDVHEYVQKENLEKVSDESEIEKYCDDAIAESEEAVKDYKRGEEKALNFIIGKVMKKTKGKASPDIVKKIIMEKISE